MLAHETVALLEGKRGLRAFANGRMARPELSENLPVLNGRRLIACDILPVHIRACSLERIGAGWAEWAFRFIAVINLH
ncbi:hypothetical protein D3C86_1940600 [compost metagenome]